MAEGGRKFQQDVSAKAQQFVQQYEKMGTNASAFKKALERANQLVQLLLSEGTSKAERNLQLSLDDAVRRGGIKSVYFLSLAILGPSRVGKSSLLRSLLDLPYDDRTDSTRGMQLRMAMANVQPNGRWKLLDDIITALHRLLCSTLLRESSSLRHQEPPTSEDILSKAVLGLMKEAKLTDSNEQEDLALLSTIDLAGQQVYQCLQPLFTSPNSAFAICFDSSKGINEKVSDVYEANGSTYHLPGLADGESQLEKMLSWLDIYFQDGQSRYKGDGKCALLVGCKDDLRGSRLRPCQEIWRQLRSTKFNDVVHDKIFYVDNTKSGPLSKSKDKGVEDLRMKINSMAKNQAKIPVLWLLFTIELKVWRQKSQQPWMQKTEATKLALSLKSITSEDQMDDLLLYHHEMGQLAYFPDSNLKDILILDLQYVVDSTNALLDPCKRLPSALSSKLEAGLISEEALLSCFKRYFEGQPEKMEMLKDSAHVDNLIGLLEQLLVVLEVGGGRCRNPSQARCNKERVFVCPAAAKDYSPSRDPSRFEISPRICFPIAGDGHFPPYLYWQVVLSCIEMVRRRGEDITDVELSLTRARLPWHANHSCWIYLHHGKRGLVALMEQQKATTGDNVWPRGKYSGKEALSAISSSLRKVMERDNYNRRELDVAVPCRCGSNEFKECFLHGIRYCSYKACFHTCKLEATAGQVPKCPVSKESQDVRDCVRFWLCLDQTPQHQLVDIPSEPTQGGRISQYGPLLPTLPTESTVSLVALPSVSEEATSSATTLSSVPQETHTSVTISSTAAASPDPWICLYDPQYHDWLINLDMALFRNNAIQAGLISSEESENLSATTRSGSQVHNALLLAFAKRGGRKSFHRLLDTLTLMGESGNKKWLQLVNLLPVTEQDQYLSFPAMDTGIAVSGTSSSPSCSQLLRHDHVTSNHAVQDADIRDERLPPMEMDTGVASLDKTHSPVSASHFQPVQDDYVTVYDPANDADVRDPFADPRFPQHHIWLMELDPGVLRHEAYRSGSISSFQFSELSSIKSPAEHNTQFLSYFRPFGLRSFKALLSILEKAFPMCVERLQELEELCRPEQQNTIEPKPKVRRIDHSPEVVVVKDVSNDTPNVDTKCDPHPVGLPRTQALASHGVEGRLDSLRATPKSSPTEDPWQSIPFRMCSKALKERLPASDFRSYCFMLGIISSERGNKLRSILTCGGTEAEHNEELLAIIMKNDDEGFAQLREIVRSFNHQVKGYEKILSHLNTVGWAEDDQRCLQFRQLLSPDV